MKHKWDLSVGHILARTKTERFSSFIAINSFTHPGTKNSGRSFQPQGEDLAGTAICGANPAALIMGSLYELRCVVRDRDETAQECSVLRRIRP
jgi:hypothetical protein